MKRATTSSPSCTVEGLPSFLGLSSNQLDFTNYLEHSRLVSRSNLSHIRVPVNSFACSRCSWQSSKYGRIPLVIFQCSLTPRSGLRLGCLRSFVPVYGAFRLIPNSLLENLAAQRVQHLTPYVVPALAFGCLDPETRFEPLKVMNVVGKALERDSDALLLEYGYRPDHSWTIFRGRFLSFGH